jgi:hypothetical protein
VKIDLGAKPVISLPAVPAMDTTAAFHAGEWGLGVRPFGTTTSILAYRALAPGWVAALRLNWSMSNSDHDMPSGSSTTVTTYDFPTTNDATSTTSTTGMDTDAVTRSNSFTAVLGPEYELPMGRGIDFKAGAGLVVSWSWGTTHQWIANGATTSTSYASTWALAGGLSESAGFRWWFLPRRIAFR